MRVKRARSGFAFFIYISHVQSMRSAHGAIVLLGVKVPERAGPRGSVSNKPELNIQYCICWGRKK